jgi:hypothetical protein
VHIHPGVGLLDRCTLGFGALTCFPVLSKLHRQLWSPRELSVLTAPLLTVCAVSLCRSRPDRDR